MSVVAKIKKLIAENPKDKAEWSFVAKKTLVALLFLYHKSTKLTSQREKVYQTLGIVEKPKFRNSWKTKRKQRRGSFSDRTCALAIGT